MPTFLYHLKLELYSHPAGPDHSTTRARDIYLPPSSADIFNSQFPTHRSSPWTSDFLHKRPKSSISSDLTSRTPELRPVSAGQSDQVGDALLLPERNTALKDNPVHVPSSPRPSPRDASKDWRFGPVTIDRIDMEGQRGATEAKSQDANRAGAKGPSGLHTRAVYVPGETKTTDVGWGVVHLYKDSQEVADLDSSRTGRGRTTTGEDGSLDIDKCSTLCILAVPSWMMPSDLLGFVGDQTREDVSHFRLIRTGRANKYMVLMKFRSPKKARDWQKAWNGRLFSAMEPENCHVVFIASVSFLTPENNAADFPQNNQDPFTSATTTATTLTPPTSKPYAPPTPSLIELPTCPVCLERMDETTGLLTILCQHVFHCACLEKWRGSGCPVCRYTQSPSSTFPYPRPNANTSHGSNGDALPGAGDADAEPACSVCAATANLWICLICGNVGCGRYDEAHAHAHYDATSHCYAMDIASQHVWDYAGDGYVHRLIQNKDAATFPSSNAGGAGGGGRYIDLPSSRPGRGGGGGAHHHHHHHPNSGFRAESDDSVPREKMEAMANEYTYLLTSQLDSQRRYFEEQVERAVDKASGAAARADDAVARLEGAAGRLAVAEGEREALRAEVEELGRQLEKVKVRCGKFEEMARRGMDGVREEKTINEGLMVRIGKLEADVKGKEEEVRKGKEEIAELKELNRDLTMFVEGREQLRKMEEEDKVQAGELQEGAVSVPERPSEARRKGKGRKR